MRDQAALKEFCDETASRFGGIDIVVANAGVGAYGPFLELSLEFIDEMIDVNLKGTLYAVRAALPHMLGREGDVITLASEAGRRGLPLEAVDRASKFGQVGFTGAITSVSTGSVHERVPRRCRHRLRARARRGRSSEARRGMMTAEDVAEVVVFVLERPRHLRIFWGDGAPAGHGGELGMKPVRGDPRPPTSIGS